jgi:FlaA1/EpsC-like NDP-sugar epimerase
LRTLNPRTVAAFLHDVIAAGVAWCIAFLLRFNFDIPHEFALTLRGSIVWVMGLHALLFWPLGLYRGIWRYASLHDLRRILIAVTLAAVAVPALFILLRVSTPVPRSVFVLSPLLLLLVMGGSRLAYRAWKERYVIGLAKLDAKPVLILGAGSAAVSLIKELAPSREWRVVGLLDDSPGRLGREMNGVPILGALERLPEHAKRLAVGHAIVAMPGASHQQRRHAVNLCAEAGVAALTLPGFDDLVTGKVTVSQLRSVELDDLLGRDPVSLDTTGLSSLLGGRSVMVTGAGGSIGSELCRQIARFGPARLILFELSEFALYRIEQEFEAAATPIRVVALVGDCKDAARVGEVMARERPDVVFHAAAYKHVPLMEVGNAWEAVRNNVLGTLTVAEAAARAGVGEFVLISTDKAVNPVNVMGATKRLAEMVCQAQQGQGAADGTRFVMVRFGNVLGSAGSVIPKFREQIARGGPVTVTHPEITRYFMSIPEASQLVLQAGLMGKGGEIFVLDMGEPVKITDLARDLIRLSGFTEDDVRIEYTGLRPGEKLFEELLADGEQTLPTPHPKLRIARALGVDAAWLERLRGWLLQSGQPDDAAVRATLVQWVPDYLPAGHLPPAVRIPSEIAAS